MSKEQIRQVRQCRSEPRTDSSPTGAGLCPCRLVGSRMSEVPVPGRAPGVRAGRARTMLCKVPIGGWAHVAPPTEATPPTEAAPPRPPMASAPLGAPCPGGCDDRACGLRAHPVRPVPLPLPGSQLPASSLSICPESPGHLPPLSTGAPPLGSLQASPGDGKGVGGVRSMIIMHKVIDRLGTAR